MRQAALQRLAVRLGLPPMLWFDGVHGLRGQFSGAHLVALAWHHDGLAEGLQLALSPRARTGRLCQPEGSGGTADEERYARGQWERFDAWSDNVGPSAMGWSAWVERSVVRIVGRPGCRLCGQRLSEERAAAHTADGFGHVCGPCVRHLKQAPPTPRQWPLGTRRCGACGREHADDDVIFEGRGGRLCPPCVGLLRPVDRGRWDRLRRALQR